MIETYRPPVVLVDLNAADLSHPAALIAYQQIAGPDAWFVAFGSHVDIKSLAAARPPDAMLFCPAADSPPSCLNYCGGISANPQGMIAKPTSRASKAS